MGRMLRAVGRWCDGSMRRRSSRVLGVAGPSRRLDGRRGSRGRRRPARPAAGPGARHRRSAARSAPAGRRRARTGRARPRAAARRPPARATIRWSSASASSKASVSTAGATASGASGIGPFVATRLLGFGVIVGDASIEPPGDKDTHADADDERTPRRRPGTRPARPSPALASRSSAVAGSEPPATSTRKAVPPGASAGSRTIAPSARAGRSRSRGRGSPAGRGPPSAAAVGASAERSRSTRRMASVESGGSRARRRRSRASRRRQGRRHGPPAARRSAGRRPAASPIARVARSSRRPLRSRLAASCAAGCSRSRARRSATTSRDSVATCRADGAIEPSPGPAQARRPAPTRSGTTSSAAADGVAARTSAAKSVSVTSTSWPMPATTGMGCATTARTTRSSLNAHRSSSEPPPRATIVTRGRVVGASVGVTLLHPALHAAERRRRCWPGASSPCTRAATRTTCTSGQRRASTVQTSRHTAPVGEVTTAMVAGPGRQRPLARRVEQALGGQAGLERLEAQGQVAEPRRLDRVDVELQRARSARTRRSGRGRRPGARPAPRTRSASGRRGTRRTGAGCARP